MAYFPKDAAVMERLRGQLEALGMPLDLFRKFNMLIGAINVQVEVEGPSRPVIETVFAALRQQANEIRQPESDQIKRWIADCQAEITKRLNRRDD